MVLLLFVTVGGLTQVMNAAFGLWFVPVILFGGTTWVALRRQNLKPLRATRAAFGSPSLLLMGFLFGLANFFAVVIPLQLVATYLAPEALRKVYDSTQVFEGQSTTELALIVSAVCVAAPFFEEFFFRGFLQRGLTKSGLAPLKAVLWSAAIFSAFHMDPIGFLARVELGVLFGLLVVYTGSLWPAVGAHVANNAISTLIYFASKQELATAAVPPDEPGFGQIAFLVGLGLLGMAGLYRWLKNDDRFRVAAEFPDDAQVPQTIPPSVYSLAAPWIVAGVLSIAALLAIDPTGVRLNLFDASNRLPKVEGEVPAALQEEKKTLKALRQQVREGEFPLEAYQKRRRALVIALEGVDGGEAAELDGGASANVDGGVATTVDAGSETRVDTGSDSLLDGGSATTRDAGATSTLLDGEQT